MSNFAKGKYAKAISDRSGMEFPYNEMVTEWNGSRVHVSEFEPKQPQLELQVHGADPEALKDIRADRTEPATERLLPLNAFTHPTSESIIKIFEPGHGRSTGDTVRFRNVVDIFAVDINSTSGHTITKIDDDFYSISTGGLAHAGAPIKGGGEIASAGPVTITP
tara:strand:- start:413 stop:904 length:492 start_codon:yes stop_codon:yes gene_type:complete